MRRQRFTKNIAYYFRNIFSLERFRLWIVLIVIAAVAVTGVILLRGKEELTPKDTSLYGKKHIVVGVETGYSSFAEKTPEGDIVGFEPELAQMLISELYPESTVEFVSIESQQASYLLRKGEIDFAFAMLPQDVLKTDGIPTSDSYYKDELCAFVKADSPIKDVKSLDKKSVLYMITECRDKTLKKKLEELSVNIELIPCSSYTDGIESVEMGNVSALVACSHRMAAYSNNLNCLESPILELSYHAAVWTSNKNVLPLINDQLAKIKKNGEYVALLSKWGLS